jgi:hypothetical protein
MAMAKEKVTLTLDTARLNELRDLVGSRSISAAVDDAVGAHVLRLRHLVAVDDWLAELERIHGPIQPETLEWAAQLVERWESSAAQSRRRVRRTG